MIIRDARVPHLCSKQVTNCEYVSLCIRGTGTGPGTGTGAGGDGTGRD